MLTPLEQTDLALALERYPGSGPSVFDHVETSDHGICWAALRHADLWYVLFRGSANAEDWFRDFVAITWPVVPHSVFGALHPGFSIGLQPVVADILALTQGEDAVFMGHSLGAGHAQEAAAYAKQRGVAPVAFTLWGAPRAGFAKLARYLSDIPTRRSYRNHFAGKVDPVTCVPLRIPPAQNYVPCIEPIDVYGAPPENLSTGLLAPHHLIGYRAGIEAL